MITKTNVLQRWLRILVLTFVFSQISAYQLPVQAEKPQEVLGQFFLTLPFNDPDVTIEQGWKCHENQKISCSSYDPYGHVGIDFTKGNIATGESFPVLAAGPGHAICETNNPLIGNNVKIYHNIFEEKDYYTRYSHLQSCVFNEKDVYRGEYIGTASNTGSPLITNIHLHFSMRNVKDYPNEEGADGLIDPYAIYDQFYFYPQPGTSQKIANNNHFWTTNPPSYPDKTLPIGSISSPTNDSNIGINPVYISANAIDELYGSGIEHVEFYVKYNSIWHHVMDDRYYPFATTWTPPYGISPQDIQIRVAIVDYAGNKKNNASTITVHFNPYTTIVVEDPVITPPYAGMCESYWYRYSNIRGHYAYLTLNTNVPAQSTNWATWAAYLLTGTYKVEAFIPDHDPIQWQCPSKLINWDTSDARYTIYHANGNTTVSASQRDLFDAWLNLGVYSFDGGNQTRVKLTDLNGESDISFTVSFSAMKFTQQSAPPPPDTTKPFGNITAPAHLVTVGPGALYMSADAWDNISGSGVNKVEFWVKYNNEWNLIRTEQFAPYEATWTIPSDLSDQKIEVGIHVVDNAGNVAIDPGGKRIIYYKSSGYNSVPFFSQQDPRWQNYPLNGTCGCNTIGACGCTLTAATMLFDYFGANHNPKTLSACMGNNACPFKWYPGATCSGFAEFAHDYNTSNMSNAAFWSLLETQVASHPVLLGMHRNYNTHWILVLSGQGNQPSNYTIHDPWPLNGANMKLSAYSNWYYDRIVVYEGTKQSTETQKSQPELSALNTDISLQTLDVTTLVSETEASSLQTTSVMTTSIVTGSVNLYRMTELTMTLYLDANSTEGLVTEMLIWTDEMTDTVWLPFSSYLELPKADEFTVRFRDELGNVSEIYENTSYPISNPQTNTIEYIYLPVIRK